MVSFLQFLSPEFWNPLMEEKREKKEAKKAKKAAKKEGRKAKEEGPSHRACFMVGS